MRLEIAKPAPPNRADRTSKPRADVDGTGVAAVAGGVTAAQVHAAPLAFEAPISPGPKTHESAAPAGVVPTPVQLRVFVAKTLFPI